MSQAQGIDVSDHQGTIDWNAVRQAGQIFTFVKATDGITWTDPEFAANWSAAKAAGLLRGAYHFYSYWNSLGTSAFGRYPLWVAEYGVSSPKLPSGWTGWTFWQYSETGTVAGVSGAVDLDVFSGSLADLQALAQG